MDMEGQLWPVQTGGFFPAVCSKHHLVVHTNPNGALLAAAPMILEGIFKGEKTLYALFENPQEDLIAVLKKKNGLPVSLLSKALETIRSEAVYLENGVFEPKRVLAFWEKKLLEAKLEGFSGLRVFGEMGWILDYPGCYDALLEYEASIEAFVLNLSILVFCFYNSTRTGYGLVRRLLASHQVMHF